MAANLDNFRIVVDLRCLQDPSYVSRGVGRHALALLRHAPPEARLVGLIDNTLPQLLSDARAAVAEVHFNSYAVSGSGSPEQPPVCVILPSPMTHDPLFVARLLSDQKLLRAAVVHDFIPSRIPDRYLPGPADQLNYAIALRWLARCDIFLPNSRSSADDLAAILGVAKSRVVVTGCALDPAFESATERSKPSRHLLVVGGGDPRKNPEVVVRAHATSRLMQRGAGIPLVITGSYSEADANVLRDLARAAGGRAHLVEVPGHVSDSRLLDLYGEAFAIVCPSHDEGFSIPVIEGMATGLPCLASDIRAHAELVTDPDNRFPANDDAILRSKLERALTDADWRAKTLALQASIWPHFRANEVAERFWGALRQRLSFGAPAILRACRPRVALLSPVPPETSGVADYTAATCTELGKLVDLHVFTETERPAPVHHAASVRPLSALPHVHAGFDRIVSVVGNSHFHLRIFEMLRRYGGACIAHDARMLGFYRVLLGQERALAVAGKELGRRVTEGELNVWLGDEGTLQALFLGEIAESAAPTIVHSSVTADMFPPRYGVVPSYLPFSIYRPWTSEELAPAHRAAARARLQIPAREVAIATFGSVQAGKAPEECIWALDALRGWGVPAKLHFVGHVESPEWSTRLRALAADLGLEDQVRFAPGYVSEQTYRDYLLGADLGIQLRTYTLGGLSGALLDCAAAGLPSVANRSLIAAVGVPEYVRGVPDELSPLLLAEALIDLLEAGFAAKRPEAARQAYAEQRSFVRYARGLCRTLALAA